MIITFLFVTTAVNGILTHVVALLTDRGIPVQVATAALSASGLALIGGRVAGGFLLDRMFGPYVAIFFFLCPVIGIGLLATGAVGPVPFVGALLCGLAIGAELDFMAFFVSRYFGLKAFGEIYGCMMCALAVGSGLGSYFMGLSFDLTHSYQPTLIIFEGLPPPASLSHSLVPIDFLRDRHQRWRRSDADSGPVGAAFSSLVGWMRSSGRKRQGHA